jgi:hypothetical protein
MTIFSVTGPEGQEYDDLYRTHQEARRAIGKLKGYQIHKRNWKLIYIVLKHDQMTYFRSYQKAARLFNRRKTWREDKIWIRRVR